VIGDIEKGYLDTCQDLALLGKVIATGEKAPSKKDVVDTILLGIESYTTAESDFLSDWRTTKSVLDGGYWLARQLRSWGLEKRWKMINEVWIEMLAYAAAHCPRKEHAQQLRRGGELLTHVSFLMLHFGLSEQYEYFRFEDVQVLSCWNLTVVSIAKINKPDYFYLYIFSQFTILKIPFECPHFVFSILLIK
jgi:hypothetical protein